MDWVDSSPLKKFFTYNGSIQRDSHSSLPNILQEE